MKLSRNTMATAVLLACSGSLMAGSVLIVNGSSVTSEPGTTSTITANLKTLHEAVGNTVTINDGLPVNLSLFAQVWDIRFSNVSALTAGEQASYLGFLQAGGGMFLMGENDFFPARNASVFDFVALAGGGVLGPNLIGGCDGTQNVIAPFTGPNPVTSVNFRCSGVLGSSGTGDWITERSSGGGTGVAFAKGDLANAAGGALTLLLDVNFMDGNGSTAEQDLLKNLIGFVGVQVNPPTPGVVPEPSTFGLAGLALLGLGLARRRKA
jgi:PEP-CTERM motif